MIQATQDLGADPELFGKPQLYARFLDSELLSANYLGVLIVVMPQGVGIAGGGRLIDHKQKFKPRPVGKLAEGARAGAPAAHHRPRHAHRHGRRRGAGRRQGGRAPHPREDPHRQGAVQSDDAGGAGLVVVDDLELGAGLAVLALVAVSIIGLGIRKSRPSEPPL